MSNSKQNTNLQPFQFFVKEGVIKFKPPIENEFGEFKIEFNNSCHQDQDKKTDSSRVINQSRSQDNLNNKKQIQVERRTKNQRKQSNVNQMSQNFPKLENSVEQKYNQRDNLSPAKRMRILSNQVSQDSPFSKNRLKQKNNTFLQNQNLEIQVDELSSNTDRMKDHLNGQFGSGNKTQNNLNIPILSITDDFQNQKISSHGKIKMQFTIDPVGKKYDLCKIHSQDLVTQPEPFENIKSRKSFQKNKSSQRAGQITAERQRYIDLYGEEPETPPEMYLAKNDHKRRKSDSQRFQYKPQMIDDQVQDRQEYAQTNKISLNQQHEPSHYRVNSKPKPYQYLDFQNSRNNYYPNYQNFEEGYIPRMYNRFGQPLYTNQMTEQHFQYPIYRQMPTQQKNSVWYSNQPSFINQSIQQGRDPDFLNQTGQAVYAQEPRQNLLRPEYETRITKNNLQQNDLNIVNHTEQNQSTSMYLVDQSFASDGFNNLLQPKSNGSGNFIVQQKRNSSKKINAFDETLIPSIASKLQKLNNSYEQQNSDFFKLFNQQKLQEFEQEFNDQDFNQYQQAATVIQSAFRGHIVRKQLRQQNQNEIKVIQSTSENQRKKFVKQKSKSSLQNTQEKKKNYMRYIINWCAIKIQKTFRGFKARQYYINFYKRLNKIKRKQIQGQRRKINSSFNYGAHTLQAIILGWKVRRIFKLKQVKNEIYLVKEHLNSDLNHIVGVKQLKQARKKGIIKFLQFLQSYLKDGSWVRKSKNQTKVIQNGNSRGHFFSFAQSPKDTLQSTSNFLNLQNKRNFRGSMSMIKQKTSKANSLLSDTDQQQPYRQSTMIKGSQLRYEIPENLFKEPSGFIEITANNKFQPNLKSDAYKNLATKNYQRRISYNPNLHSRKISCSSPQTERKEIRNSIRPEIKVNLTIGSNNQQQLLDSMRNINSAQQLTRDISSEKQNRQARGSNGIVNTQTSTQDMSDSYKFNYKNRNSMVTKLVTKNLVDFNPDFNIRRSTLENKNKQRNNINLQLSGSQNTSDLFKITEENDNDIKRMSIKNSIVVSGLSRDQNQIQNLKQYISQKFNTQQIVINSVDDGQQLQAIIDFLEPETAVLAAVCLNGFEFQGQKLFAKVRSINNFQKSQPTFEITNMPQNVSKEQINNIVSNYGEVASIEINSQTKSAVVVMKNKEESMNAIISLQQGKGLKIQGNYVKIKPIQEQSNFSNILEIYNLPKEITDQEIEFLQKKLEKTAKGFDFDLVILPSADGETSQAIVKFNHLNNLNLVVDTNQVIIDLSKFKLKDNIVKIKKADFQSIEITQIDPNITQETVKEQIQSLGGTLITFTNEGNAIARFNDHNDTANAMNFLKSNNILSQNLQVYPILIPQNIQEFDITQKILQSQTGIPSSSLNIKQITNFEEQTQIQKQINFGQSNATSWLGEGGKEYEIKQLDFSATDQSKLNFKDLQMPSSQIHQQFGSRPGSNWQVNNNRQSLVKDNQSKISFSKNTKENLVEQTKDEFGKAIQIDNLPLEITDKQIDLLFNEIKSSVNEVPIVLDIIKSSDGLSCKAIVRLEQPDEAQFEFNAFKKQIERLNISGRLIEAKPANFQSIEVIGFPKSYPQERFEKIIQNLGGQIILPSQGGPLVAKFDSHSLALDAIQSLDQFCQQTFSTQVDVIPYLEQKNSRNFQQYQRQKNLNNYEENQNLNTTKKEINFVKLLNLPQNITRDEIIEKISQNGDFSLISIDNNSAIIELHNQNSAQSVLNSLKQYENLQGVKIQSINNPEEDPSEFRQSLVYDSKVLQIDNLPTNISDKQVDELFGIIQASVKDAPISLDIITQKDGTGNKAIVRLDCSVQQALNLGVSMAHVENSLQNIKLNGQKIETHPADFLSIEITGISKNISKDEIEQFVNSLGGEMVHKTQQEVVIAKFLSTNQAVDAIPKINDLSMQVFGQKVEVIPILTSENQYQVRNNQIRKSILDLGDMKTNLINNNTLQLKNLPKKFSVDKVKNLVNPFGQVNHVIIDPISNSAQVHFKDQNSAETVLTLLKKDEYINQLDIQAEIKQITPPQQIIRQSIIQTKNSVIRRSSIQSSQVIQINNLASNISEYQVDKLFEKLQSLIPGAPISLDIVNSIDGQSNHAIVRLNCSIKEAQTLRISMSKFQKEIENMVIGGSRIKTQQANFSSIEITNISNSISKNFIEQEIKKIGGELVTIRQDGVAIVKFFSTDHAANAIDKIYQKSIFGSKIKIAPILDSEQRGSNYEISSSGGSQKSIESEEPPQVLEISNIPISGDKDLVSLKKNLQNILGASCTIEIFDQPEDDLTKNVAIIKLDAFMDEQELQKKLEFCDKQLLNQFKQTNLLIKQTDFNQVLIQLDGDFNKSKLKSQFIDEIQQSIISIGAQIIIKENISSNNSVITEIQMIFQNNENAIVAIDKIKQSRNDKFKSHKQNIKIIPFTQQIIKNTQTNKIGNNTVILSSKALKNMEILNLQREIQKLLPEMQTKIEIVKNQDSKTVQIICENPEQAILAAIKLDGIILEEDRIQAKVGNLQNIISLQLENLPTNITTNQIQDIISRFGNVTAIELNHGVAVLKMETKGQEIINQLTGSIQNLGKQIQIKTISVDQNNVQVIQISDLPRDITDEQTDRIFSQVQKLAKNIPIQFDIIKSGDGETSHGLIRIAKPIEELKDLGLNMNEIALEIKKIKLDGELLQTKIGDFSSIEILGFSKLSKRQLEQEITNLGGQLISFSPGVNAVARFIQTNQALNAIDKIQNQREKFGPKIEAYPILVPRTCQDSTLQSNFEKKIDEVNKFILIDNLPANISPGEISKLQNQLQTGLRNDNISIEILKQGDGEPSKAIVSIQQSLVNISRKSVKKLTNYVKDTGLDLEIQQCDFTQIKISGNPQFMTQDHIKKQLTSTDGFIQSLSDDGSTILTFKSSQDAVDAILQINQANSGRDKLCIAPILVKKNQRKSTIGIIKNFSQEESKNKLVSIVLEDLPKQVTENQIKNLFQKYGEVNSISIDKKLNSVNVTLDSDIEVQQIISLAKNDTSLIGNIVLIKQIQIDQQAKRNSIFRRSSLQTSKVLQINNLPADMNQAQIQQLQELVSNSVNQAPIALDILNSDRGTTSQAIVRLTLPVSEQIKLGISINSVQEDLNNMKIGNRKIDTQPAIFTHIEIIGIPQQISQNNFETIIKNLDGQILYINQQGDAIIQFNSTDQTVFAIDEINKQFQQNYRINVQINPILSQEIFNNLLIQNYQTYQNKRKISQKIIYQQNGMQNISSSIIGIQNLPKNLTDQQVDEFFKQIEQVTGVYSELDLINAPDGQSSQAIITFQNETTAETAIKKLKNIQFLGNSLVASPILLQSLTLHNLPKEINLSQLLQAVNIVLQEPIRPDQAQISEQQQYDYDLNKLVCTAEINFNSQKQAQKALKIINETLSLGGEKIIAFPNFKNLIDQNTINQRNQFKNNKNYFQNDQVIENQTIISEEEFQTSKNLIARRLSKSYTIQSGNIFNFGGQKSNISDIDLNRSNNNHKISITKLIQNSENDQYENDSQNPFTDFSGLLYTRPQSKNNNNTIQNSEKTSNSKQIQENQDNFSISDSYKIIPHSIKNNIYENSKQNRNFDSLNSKLTKLQTDNQQTFGSPYEDNDSQTQFEVSAISRFPQSDQINQSEQFNQNNYQQTDQKIRKKPFEFTLNKIDQESSLRQKSIDKNKNNFSQYDQSNNDDFDNTSGMSPISRLSSNQYSTLKDNILNDSSAEKGLFKIHPQKIRPFRNITGSVEYGPQETSDSEIQDEQSNKVFQPKPNTHIRQSVAERFTQKQNKNLKINETFQSEEGSSYGGSGTKIKEVKERITKILQFTDLEKDQEIFTKKFKTSNNGDEQDEENNRKKQKKNIVIDEEPRQNETQATPKTQNILSPKIINLPSSKISNDGKEIPDPDLYQITPYSNKKKNPIVQVESSIYTIPSNRLTDDNNTNKLKAYMEKKDLTKSSQRQKEQVNEEKVDKKNSKSQAKKSFKNTKVQNSFFDYTNQLNNQGTTKTVQFQDSKDKIKDQSFKKIMQSNKLDYSHIKSKIQSNHGSGVFFRKKSALDSQMKPQKNKDQLNTAQRSIQQNNIEIRNSSVLSKTHKKDYRPDSPHSKKKNQSKPDFSHIQSKISFDKPGVIWRFNSRPVSRANNDKPQTFGNKNNEINMNSREDRLLISERVDRNLNIRVFASSCLTDYPDPDMSPSRFKKNLRTSNSIIEIDKWCTTASCPGCHRHHFQERESSNYSYRSRQASRVRSLKRALSSSPVDQDRSLF